MNHIEKIKQLRDTSNRSLSQCRRALEIAEDDIEKAKEILSNIALVEFEKRKHHTTNNGHISSYIHMNKIGVMVELNCETDFAALSEPFRRFADDLCLQAAASNDVDNVMSEHALMVPEKTVGQLHEELVAKLGENVVVRRIVKWELGQKSYSLSTS